MITARPRGDDADFEQQRPRLEGLAYRITGSRSSAEDIVQDAWLRWQGADQAAIERPAAWLTTVTSRLALDQLKSARHTRETYVGPWLPEVANADPGPAEQAELAESVTIGFLTVLERLGPVERVVFLLADVFGLPFDEIATVVDKTPEACRQIASRARTRVRQDRPRYAPTDDDAWQVSMAFMAAAQVGDLDSLVSLLADDALAISDGGADHHAARRPVVAERIPRFVANLTTRAAEGTEYTLQLINGQPGVVCAVDGRPYLAIAFAVAGGQVQRVWTIINPDKLTTLSSPPIA
ncbi:RNA polymerase sigma factor SigJ [Aquihabitans sp. McL0605]|uniref:RNA polymerase sigma factor SigJ n=1 Tax=Aquihabitans sp. McL0605 TaxID=3415671 RepID=UPI003CE68C75